MAKLYFKVASDWEEVVRLRNEIGKLKQELKNMDSTQTPAAFKTLNTQLAASNQRMNELVTEAAKAGAVIEGNFKKKIFDASQSVNGFTEKIITQKSVIKDVEADVKRLGDAYRTALKRDPMSSAGKLEEYKAVKRVLDEEKAALFDLTQQQANARLSVKKLRDEYSLYKNDGNQVIETNKNIDLSLSKALGVIGGVAALKQLGSEIIRVRGEAQSMQAAMETLVGKDVAESLMAQIKELAKISPLTMSDMVSAEKMMLGFNIQAEDTIKYLKAISDISMGESSKFNSLTLAFSQMSAAGKLMGQDLNQMINAGFNPLQTISEKTGKSIATLKDEMSKGVISAEMVQQAFIDATSAGGKFFGMSENASKTINGQISMMYDALDNAFNEIGQRSEEVIMKGIQTTTSLIENYETVGKILAGLIATYGAYRAAVLLVTAAESKHTLVEIGLTNARILARKAQLALNASMLANPYVLLAVAVGGLATAMWAMSDNTTAAARAQKEYNDIKEKASKQEQEHKQKIEELLTAARDESLATLTRQKSLEELRKEYPKIFEQYDLEKLKLTDLLELKKQINEEDSKRSVEGKKTDYSSLKQTVSNQQRFLQLKDNPDLRKNMSDADKDVWKMFAGKQSYVQVREEMQKNAEMLKLLQKDIIADNIASYKAELKNYSKEKLEAEVKMAQSDAAKRNGYNIGGFMIKGPDLDSVISSINGTLAEKKSPSTYKADYEKAEKDWKEAKEKLSDIEKDKSKFTTKQYEEAKKLKESKEKRFKDLGGDTKGVGEKASIKAIKQENSIISQNEKIAEIERKQAIDRQRQQEDLENQLAQSRIDAMDKGYEKEQAQLELNNKKEIQSLQRQKEDYIKTYTQAQKELFDAQEDLKAKKDSKYKKKTFDSSSASVDTSAFDAIINNTGQRQTREQSEYYKDLLSKYHSYTEKRLAAQVKFQKDREILIKAGASNETLAEHDYQRDETLKSIDNEFAMREDSFKAWADSITDLSLKKLRELLEQAEQELQDLETLNPNDHKLASQRAKVTSLKNTISERSEKAKTSPDKRSLKDWQDLYKTLSKVEKEFDEIGKTVGGTAGEIVSAAGGITSSTLQMIDGIMMLSNSASWSMTATATAAQKAIKMVENASVILAVISAALQVTTKIFDLFGRDTTTEKYEEAKDAYQSYINILDKVIDKQLELAETLTGDNANAAYEKAIEMVKTQSEAARVLGKQYLNSGASWKSRSKGYEEVKNMSLEGWVDAAKALDMSVEQFKNVMGGRMTGLFDLTDDQLTQLQENAHIFWAQLDSDTQNYANQIAEGVIQVKEVLEQQMSDVTLIDVDGLRNDFQDLLTDMDSDTADFAGNFEEYMRNAILNSMLKESYMDRLKKWREKFYNAMDDGMTQKEYEDLKAEGQQISGEMKAERDKIKDIFGWTDSYSQASSKGSFQTMSQDTGNELNGRFTALQMSGEEIKTHSILQTQSLNILTMKADAILSVNMESRNIADEIRTVQVNSYLELQEIRQNTGDTVKQLKSMDEKLKKIESNTNKL